MGRGGEVLPSRDSTRIVISDAAKIGVILLLSKFWSNNFQSLNEKWNFFFVNSNYCCIFAG